MSEATSWLALQGLSQADLDANRQGRITEVQGARIRKEVDGRKKLILIAMLFGAAGACGAIATKAAHARDLVLAIPVIITVDLLAGLLIFKLIGRKVEREIAHGAVTAIEGPLRGLWVGRGGFVCVVNRRRYQAMKMLELGKVLKNGDAVRLHVLPGTRMIVSVEPPA